jgi:hypothetical protein
MTLLIANFDPTDGTVFESATVFFHLAKLVQGDSEIGMHADPLDASVSLIDYKTPATHGFCQTVISDLANKSFSNRVIIHGVTSNYLVQKADLQRYHQISEFGGIVMYNPSVSLAPIEVQPYTTLDLHVIYDVQECNGVGYVVFDSSKQIIGLPIEILLLHELSHAYHYCERTFDFNNPEQQAEKDENSARTQLGYKLRNVDDHDGRCRNTTEPSDTKTFWDSCFIVSAAYGSPRAAEVRALQAFRDGVLRKSRICWIFFELFFEDYYRFSPDIATAMVANPQMAEIVRDAIVEPLLEFWSWSRAYIINGYADRRLAAAVLASIQRNKSRSTIFRDSELRHRMAEMVAGVCDSWRTTDTPRDERRAREPDDPGRTLRELAEAMIARVVRPEIIHWALLQPIAIYWRFASLDISGLTWLALSHDLTRAIEDWVCRLPLPAECLPTDPDILRAYLRDLKRNIVSTSNVRSRIRRVILDCDRTCSISGLETMLTEEGFAPSDPGGGNLDGRGTWRTHSR